MIPFQTILYDCVKLWSSALDVSLVGPGQCSLYDKCDRNQLAAHKDICRQFSLLVVLASISENSQRLPAWADLEAEPDRVEPQLLDES